MEFKKFDNGSDALRAMTDQLKVYMEHKADQPDFNLALSGGETAKKMFEIWRDDYVSDIDWSKIRFFWVDERCVPNTNPMSNYGEAMRLFLKPFNIPSNHIFPIHGDVDPGTEAMRYSRIAQEHLPSHRNIPYFDAIILGIGPDSHTASIFPDNLSLLTDSRSYAATINPATNQWRITMTGTLILNDSPILIPIIGKEKAEMFENLQEGYKAYSPLPAPYILTHAVDATVYAAV